MSIFAHTPRGESGWQLLSTHLAAVAKSAGEFASPFESSSVGLWLGAWHDIGKAHPDFQTYLQRCAAEPAEHFSTIDHKGAGTLSTLEYCEPLAYVIHGHHGGLPDKAELISRCGALVGDPTGQRARDVIGFPDLSQFLPIDAKQQVELPDWVKGSDPLILEMYLRMVFSALIDADHLDTELHWEPASSKLRRTPTPLNNLDAKMRDSQAEINKSGNSELAQMRRDVYRHCLDHTNDPSGFFRLTAPTGIGKTRTVMAFALAHASHHKLRHIVSVAPYLTITDQTASVYREIFGSEHVLEHFSDANWRDDPEGSASLEAEWQRLASQNWDAPIIITTSVQFFESLFGNKPGVCRKLHRLARSVIVLDEPQTLPPGLLAPIASGLNELVEHYGATVVFCTATQPALEEIPGFPPVAEITELAPDPPALFSSMNRVMYSWPAKDEKVTWEILGAELAEIDQALAILNTLGDSLALLNAIDRDDAFYLSTYLCGKHRRDVLENVRQRLSEGEPCLLVSTQVVEAGVDLDFPVVYRAMGPLDRIVQAAGRCNREGLLESGRMVVFDPAEGSQPAGSYRIATANTATLLASGPINPNDPETIRRYFRMVYDTVDLDARQVQSARKNLDFRTASQRFRLIDEPGESVIVRYPPDQEEVDELLSELRRSLSYGKGGLPRQILEQLQPYIVTIRPKMAQRLAAEGACEPLTDGLWIWQVPYDLKRGIGGVTTATYEPGDLMV